MELLQVFAIGSFIHIYHSKGFNTYYLYATLAILYLVYLLIPMEDRYKRNLYDFMETTFFGVVICTLLDVTFMIHYDNEEYRD
jgi:uncharacterized membrane protein